MRRLTLWIAPFLLGVAVAAMPADAKDDAQTIEAYYLEAGRILHHTCKSLVMLHLGDEEALVEDIAKLVAVSVINRDIDLAGLERSDAERAALREEFFDELGDRCRLDENALIAGVVDRIVADLARIY